LILSLILCAQALATLLINISNKVDLAECSTNYINIFLLLGVSSLSGLTIPGLFPGTKQVVLFSEPSHYAIALTPLLFTSLCISSRLKIFNFIQVICLIVLCFFLESVTLAAIVLLASLAHYVMQYKQASERILRRNFASTIILVILGIATIYLVTQNQYFLERLNFINIDLDDTASLSSNVSLAMGYQEAYLNLLKSHFLGLGFQQMGICLPTGSFANAIHIVNGGYTNRYDGSILASKIVSEFGLAGVFLIVAYLSYCLKIIRTSSSNNLSSVQRLSIGLIISLVPYLFVRGGGYFGGPVLISLAGLLVFEYKENKTIHC